MKGINSDIWILREGLALNSVLIRRRYNEINAAFEPTVKTLVFSTNPQKQPLLNLTA